MLAFWFLWPWLEMMAPGATERVVTITWIAGQVEHAEQMIGALTLSFHNHIYFGFLFALDYFLSYSYSVQNISSIVLNPI